MSSNVNNFTSVSGPSTQQHLSWLPVTDRWNPCCLAWHADPPRTSSCHGALAAPTVTSAASALTMGFMFLVCTLSLCLLFCCWLALADPWKFNSDITAVTSFLLSALPIGLVAPLSSHRLLHYPQLQFFPLYIEWGQNMKQNCIYILVIYTYGKHTY